MDNADAISTLNELLEITRDGEQGFRTCAEGVGSAHLKTLMEAAAERCAVGARELEVKITSLGGTPAQGGTISGSIHRTWTDLKSAVTGMNEREILSECERGEDVAKAAYESALRKALPNDVHGLIERQYQGVKANHDRVRDLRDQAA
jgi:uncharacterized protein (TIGR02284 family)